MYTVNPKVNSVSVSQQTELRRTGVTEVENEQMYGTTDGAIPLELQSVVLLTEEEGA